MKAAQRLFISLFMILSILGSVLIRGIIGAMTDSGWMGGWLVLLCTTIILMISAYCGVKRSDHILLFVFVTVSGGLVISFGALSLLLAIVGLWQGGWTTVCIG